MSVSKVAYYILSSDSGVSAIVGTKIYPEVAPIGTVAPYIVYQEISNVPTQSKTAVSQTEMTRLQVSCFTEISANSKSAYLNGIDLANAVRTALEGVKGTISGVVVQSNIVYDGQINLNENYAGFDGVNHRALDFLIFWVR